MPQCINGHVICTKCLIEIKKGSNKCPVCCVAYRDQAIRNLYGQKVIDELPWSCVDCCTRMKRKDMVLHRQTCEEGVVKCPFHFGTVKCNTEWKKNDIAEHLISDHAVHLALMDFLQADDIIPAITLLCEGSTDHIKFAAAVALEHLARDSAYKLCMVDAGAIPSLVAAVSGIATDRLKMAATDALGAIAGATGVRNDGYRLAIAQAGAIIPIVRLLNDGGTILAKNAAARALRALSACREVAEEITFACGGVIEPLVALLSVPAADIRNIAATLEHLARHAYTRRMASQRNKLKCRIPPLVQLLSGLDVAAKEHAARALRNICNGKANCTAVVKAGAVDALVAMLHEEGHESTKKSAADALRAIVESGGNLSVQVVDKLLAWRR